MVRQLNAAATVPPVAVVSPTPAPSSTASPTVAATLTNQTEPPVSAAATVPPHPLIPPRRPALQPLSLRHLRRPARPSPSHRRPERSTDHCADRPPSGAPTAIPTGVLDPATAEEFATDLAAAISDGQNLYLLARLHPATIDRYGLEQCRAYISDTISGSPITWEVQSSAGPAPRDYITDDLTTPIACDAWAVTVRQPGADPDRDLHFAPFEGTWRWFTDGGEPL